MFPSTNICLPYTNMEMKIFESSFSPYEDLQILGMLFHFLHHLHTTLGNVKCLKLLLGVCKIEERGDLSLSVGVLYTVHVLRRTVHSNVHRRTVHCTKHIHRRIIQHIHCSKFAGGLYRRVHRVVTAAFWRTFHHEGKISPGW
jgi:hypothetical protein